MLQSYLFMKVILYLPFLLLFLSACASPKKVTSALRFSYLDGLQAAKQIDCGSQRPMDCMACALQGEAANQPGPGVYAVGVTIMTRARGRAQNICATTKARGQFEGMRKRGRKKISKKVWAVTKKIMATKEIGWTHFWAPKTQKKLNRRKPAWATTYEKRQCRNEEIGDHVFFDTNQCRYNRSMRLNAQK